MKAFSTFLIKGKASVIVGYNQVTFSSRNDVDESYSSVGSVEKFL